MTTFAPTPEPEDWHDHTACLGVVPTEAFFTPTRAHKHALAQYPAAATQACARCPRWVKAACLAEGLAMSEHDDQGYRAGLTEGDRRRLRKAQRRAS